MENNTMMVLAREYEELVRDSEKVRILTQAMKDDLLPGEAWIKCILGMQQEEEEKINVIKDQ